MPGADRPVPGQVCSPLLPSGPPGPCSLAPFPGLRRQGIRQDPYPRQSGYTGAPRGMSGRRVSHHQAPGAHMDSGRPSLPRPPARHLPAESPGTAPARSSARYGQNGLLKELPPRPLAWRPEQLHGPAKALAGSVPWAAALPPRPAPQLRQVGRVQPVQLQLCSGDTRLEESGRPPWTHTPFQLRLLRPSRG